MHRCGAQHDDMTDDASDDVTDDASDCGDDFERGMTVESDTSVSSDDSDCESPSDLEGHVGHTCEGGQFCWEDDVMVKVNGAWYPGVYEGYGYAMIHCPEGRQPVRPNGRRNGPPPRV